MPHTVMHLLSQYGYSVVFFSMLLGIVGLPLPVELLLVTAGSMAASAKLNLYLLLLVAWAGTSMGMTVNYWLGRKIGLKRIGAVTKWIRMPEEKLQKGAGYFQKFGPLAIPVGFFLAGLRHASPFISGASGMKFRMYTIYAYGGSLLWTSVFVYVGHRFSHNWGHMLKILHHPFWIVGVAGALIAVYFLIKEGMKKHETNFNH